MNSPVLVFLLFFFSFFFNHPEILSEQLDLDIKAEAAILMNADTGAVLYEKNSHELHFPASITKIATALYALKKAENKLDVMIGADQDCIGTVSEESLRRSNYTMPAYLLIPDGSHVGIKKGEQLSLRDLFYGLMVASGDDAANVIAKYVGGTIPQFMTELNEYLMEIGCFSTKFYNPHGLHHPKQLTTAYDMAILTREALKNQFFRKLVSTVSYTRPKTNKQDPSILVQTNRLIRKGPYFYSKAIGVKTGYYSLARNTLVAAAKDNDRTLIAVLLKVQERKDTFLEARKMFESAFSQPKIQRIFLSEGPQKFFLDAVGANRRISTFINENISLEYYPAEEPKLKCLLYWDNNLELPIKKGQRVGQLVLQNELGEKLKIVDLFASNAAESTWIYKIKKILYGLANSTTWIKFVGIGTLFFFFGFLLFQVIKRRG